MSMLSTAQAIQRYGKPNQTGTYLVSVVRFRFVWHGTLIARFQLNPSA